MTSRNPNECAECVSLGITEAPIYTDIPAPVEPLADWELELLHSGDDKPLTFTLTITLGNDGMQVGYDIAKALRIAAEELDFYGEHFGSPASIHDRNGNTVGSWAVA